MGAYVQPSLLSQVVRHLPRPLLRVLDAWAAREARRRRERRLLKWQQRKGAVPAPAQAEPVYHLKPWRD